MSISKRIASGVGLTLLVSGCVMYVVLTGTSSLQQDVVVEDKPMPVTSATIEKTKDSAFGFLSRIPFVPWSQKEEQLVAVMIENHQAARPYHEGLEKALLVQEFFVEGFITRFTAIFRLDDMPEEVGPVRSLRPYFIQAFLPYTPFVFHAGGSPEALDRVQNFNDVQNYNAIYLEEAYFDRKDGVPAPHDLFLTKEDVHALVDEDAEIYGRAATLPLYETGRAPAASGASIIDINFYNPVHNVEFTYDSRKREYQRINGRVISPATPENVVVLTMPVEEVGPFGRLAIESIGSGDALFFRSGKVYRGSWQRTAETEPYTFLRDDGRPMIFAAGQIWITSVNTLQRISWK